MLGVLRLEEVLGLPGRFLVQAYLVDALIAKDVDTLSSFSHFYFLFNKPQIYSFDPSSIFFLRSFWL